VYSKKVMKGDIGADLSRSKPAQNPQTIHAMYLALI
jgi:hypothetical protein